MMQQGRLIKAAGAVAVGLFLIGLGLRAEVQTPQQTTQQTNPTGLGAGSDPLGVSNHEAGISDAAAARQKRQQEMAGLNERHQHMVADADKLLQMATELKIEVDKSSKNETSVTAYNKADAIERLAHDVKQRLKN